MRAEWKGRLGVLPEILAILVGGNDRPTEPPMILLYADPSDSWPVFDRLTADLAAEFGEGIVSRQLTGNSTAPRVMLVVVGPSWQTALDDDGVPLVWRDDDPVQQAMHPALKVVLPVLLDDTSPPPAGWLRAGRLNRLCGGPWLQVRTTAYARDVAALIRHLRHRCPELPTTADGVATPTLLLPRPPALYAVPAYTLTGTAFVGRSTELDRLDEWARSPDPLLVVEGIGGKGKSALTWEWMLTRAAEVSPQLAGRVWWSFYEKGTNLAAFVRHALAYIRGQDPEVLRESTNHQQRCRELIGELRQRPHLLVLDGFERVLTAYHRWDKAQQRDDKIETALRECVEPRDADFLRDLLTAGPSKILVSTRLFPSGLENDGDARPRRGVAHLPLAGLSRPDTLAYFRSAGVRGDESALLAFAERFGNHSLLLQVICGEIAQYPPDPNGFDRWRADPDAGGRLDLTHPELKERYHRLLAFVLDGLAEPERKLLGRIAVLSENATHDTLSVLNPYLPPAPRVPHQPWHPSEFDSTFQGAVAPTGGGEPAVDDDSSEILVLDSMGEFDDNPSPDTWLPESVDDDLDDTLPQDSDADYPRHQGASLEQYQQAVAHYRRGLAEVHAHYQSSKYRRAVADFERALRRLQDRGLLQFDTARGQYDMHPVVRGHAAERLEDGDRRDTFRTAHDHFASQPPDDYERATDPSHLAHSVEIFRCLIGAGMYGQALWCYRGEFGTTLLHRLAANAVVAELLAPLAGDDTGLGVEDRLYVGNNLAIALDGLGREKEALPLFARLVRLTTREGFWVAAATNLRNVANTLRSLNRRAESDAALTLAVDLSAAYGDDHGLTRGILSQAIAAIDRGQFARAEGLLARFAERPPPPVSNYRPGEAEYWGCVLRFDQGTLTDRDWADGHAVAVQHRNVYSQFAFLVLRGRWLLASDRSDAALDAIDDALKLANRLGTRRPDCHDLRAVALARLGRADDARTELIHGEGRLYAAEAWRELGDRERWLACTRAACQWAWGDGPPHAHWHTLKRSRELLAELGEREPQLPAFDAKKVPPVPCEPEIRTALRKFRQ